MRLIQIKVNSHSGYKADEYPSSFIHYKKEEQIREITDRWYQGESNPEYPPANYFRVDTTETRNLIIKHDLRKDVWYLCIPD